MLLSRLQIEIYETYVEELYSIIFNLMHLVSDSKAINPCESRKLGVTDLKQDDLKLNDPVINAMDLKPPL
jgi:hypothetical protein